MLPEEDLAYEAWLGADPTAGILVTPARSVASSRAASQTRCVNKIKAVQRNKHGQRLPVDPDKLPLKALAQLSEQSLQRMVSAQAKRKRWQYARRPHAPDYR